MVYKKIGLLFQSTKVDKIFHTARFFDFFFVKKLKIIAILDFCAQNRHLFHAFLQASTSRFFFFAPFAVQKTFRAIRGSIVMLFAFSSAPRLPREVR